MPGYRIRLLLLVVAAVCLSNLVLSGRNRPKPSLGRSEDSSGGGPFSSLRAPSVFNRGPQHHETTIRQPAAQTVAVPQGRPIDPASRDDLIELVNEAIQKTSRRYLDVEEYTPWQIMHGILALRSDYKLRSGGKLVNGVEYISSGPIFRGDYWWEKTAAGGRGHPYSVPYHFEGHNNQFPALLSMSALPLDHELVAKGGKINVGDIVRNAQRTVNSHEEISWTLWLLTQYVDQDAEWVNQQGQRWSMAELVRLQTIADVDTAPCGGTHGLFALAFARNAYLRQHGQLRGVWVNAEYKLRRYIELARQLQNPDGSFSTVWFRGRDFTYDFKERIKCSGHMLEWLMMAVPASRLDEPWVRRAIQCVATDLIKNASAPAECGPMYHALHALVLYRERVAPQDSQPEESLASRPAQPSKPASPIPAPSEKPAPQVAAAEPRPTDPALIPPSPAAALESPNAAAPAAAPENLPRIHAAAPSQPGIVRLSPAAPATTSTRAATDVTQSKTPGDSTPKPLSAPTAPSIVAGPSAVPAPLSAVEARPIDSPMPASNGEDKGSSPTQRPLLVLKQPVVAAPAEPEAVNPPAEVPMPPEAAASTAQTGADPSEPVGEAAGDPPADLPPKVAAADPVVPADLPPGGMPPSADSTAEATGDGETPILPELALEAAPAAPEIPLIELTLEPELAKEETSGKPGVGSPPASSMRVTTKPNSNDSETR